MGEAGISTAPGLPGQDKGVRNEWHFLSRKLLEERKLGTKMANIAI